MFKPTLAIGLLVAASSAYAWKTPQEAVEKFAQFDADGGRLSSENWENYVGSIIHADEDHDEPGWDAVIVIDGFSVGKLNCKTVSCTVDVTYKLHPTKDLDSLPVIENEDGGTESVTYTVININGDWRVEADPDYPRISYKTFKSFTDDSAE